MLYLVRIDRVKQINDGKHKILSSDTLENHTILYISPHLEVVGYDVNIMIVVMGIVNGLMMEIHSNFSPLFQTSKFFVSLFSAGVKYDEIEITKEFMA